VIFLSPIGGLQWKPHLRARSFHFSIPEVALKHNQCHQAHADNRAKGGSVTTVLLFAAALVLLMLAPQSLVAQQIIPGASRPGQSLSNPILGSPSVRPVPPTASRYNETDSFANAQKSAGGTQVELQTTLTSLLNTGGVPNSVEELQQLEKQAAKVADAASACTVSVQIGPAQGCGVIITASGYILSAAHVATRPGRKANITLSNGRHVRATTLGMNRNVDAGLLKIDPNQNNGSLWPHATLGTSEQLREGMWCVATGHPGGYELSRGPVTRVGRILEIRRGSIVTDCALIGGDSGGPLFDISGRLVAIHSRIGNDVDENLHVPIDEYDKAWSRMQKGESWGYLEGFRPVLGLSGAPGSGQATVKFVRPGSPAEEAEFEPDDVIVKFGDVPISNFASLKRAVSDTMPGERVKVWISRDGQAKRLRVEIGRADD
jgi:serine protease Do